MASFRLALARVILLYLSSKLLSKLFYWKNCTKRHKLRPYVKTLKMSTSPKKRTGDILAGSLTLRANAPVRMSQRLLIDREEEILTDAFAPLSKFMSKFWPIRDQIEVTTQKHRQTEILTYWPQVPGAFRAEWVKSMAQAYPTLPTQCRL